MAWLICLPNPAVGLAKQDISREPSPAEWKADAELTDVHFASKQLGWAVGAQGTILWTHDGGRTWKEISQVEQVVNSSLSLDEKVRRMRRGSRSQGTGIANEAGSLNSITCRFESVYFQDAQHGWAVGGYKIPLVNRTRAVVMRTKDGGRSWQPSRNVMIPRVKKIQIDDGLNGWAVGESSNLFPSSLFHTTNAAFDWSSHSNDKLDDLIDADNAAGGLVVITAAGELGKLKQQRYQPAVITGVRERLPLKRIQMDGPQVGFAVGASGRILKTTNGGDSWSPLSTGALANQLKHFDLSTVALTEQTIWLAGNPGTHLFAINRITGETQSIRLPSNNAINRVQFFDEQTGWAVGALGTILATTDGGENWSVQRGKHQRLAMLCVASESSDLPFEALANYAAEESHLCGALLLNNRRQFTNREIRTAIQATERIGSVSLQAIAPNNPLAADASNQQLEEERQALLERLVRHLRTTRPSVVVFHRPRASYDTVAIETQMLLRDAIRLAADHRAFPEQLAALDLQAWQVDRLAVRDPTGQVTINAQQLLPKLGSLVEDQVAISRALTGQSVVMHERPSYQVSHLTNLSQMQASNLLSGLSGSTEIPSRSDKRSTRGSLAVINLISSKQKLFEELIKFEVHTAQDIMIWRQQAQSVALKMEPSISGVWLMQLAEHYLIAGKMALAAQANEMLVQRWPDHALTPAALVWLSQYYASEELGQIEYLHRQKYKPLQSRNSTKGLADAKIDSSFVTQPQAVQAANASHLIWTPTASMVENAAPDQEFQDEWQTALAVMEQTPAIVPFAEFMSNRRRVASQYLTQLQQTDPDLANSPELQLLSAQVTSRITGITSSESRLKNLMHQQDDSASSISLAARRELGLSNLLPETSKAITAHQISFTSTRPRLDGNLSEPFWQAAYAQQNVMKQDLHITDMPPVRGSDLVMLAYDEAFLYAGIVCRKIGGQSYQVREQARPRDADLDRRDRVEFEFDTDRDYRSTNCFTIDYRGWVKESGSGGAGWNPEWFVSHSADESTWTIELAIPLEHLSPTISPDTVWAIKVARRAFDRRNLWSGRTDEYAELQGLAAGLIVRPADFELIQFLPPRAPSGAGSVALSPLTTKPAASLKSEVLPAQPPLDTATSPQIPALSAEKTSNPDLRR